MQCPVSWLLLHTLSLIIAVLFVRENQNTLARVYSDSCCQHTRRVKFEQQLTLLLGVYKSSPKKDLAVTVTKLRKKG